MAKQAYTYQAADDLIRKWLGASTSSTAGSPISLSLNFTPYQTMIEKKGNPPASLLKLMTTWGVTNKLERAHFLSQCAYESGDFKKTTEMGNNAYFTKYEFNQGLGNTQPGDGAKFKGRGYIQLTGRSNYTEFNQYLKSKGYKDDVVKNPELVATRYAGEASLFWWTNKRLGESAKVRSKAQNGPDSQSVISITLIVAGGNPGNDNLLGKIQYFNYFKNRNI